MSVGPRGGVRETANTWEVAWGGQRVRGWKDRCGQGPGQRVVKQCEGTWSD